MTENKSGYPSYKLYNHHDVFVIWILIQGLSDFYWIIVV
jgi:hypothetical protein